MAGKSPRNQLTNLFYFLQVTYGLLEAFSFVRWPDALEDIAKYSEVLQLNFLQMAPLHCLIRGIKVGDHHKTVGGVIKVSSACFLNARS